MKKKAFGVLLAAALIVTTSGVSMASSANPGVCDGTGGNGTCVCDGTGANRQSGQKAGKNGGGTQQKLKDGSGRNNGGSQQRLKDGSGRNGGGIKDRQKLKDGSCLR